MITLCSFVFCLKLLKACSLISGNAHVTLLVLLGDPIYIVLLWLILLQAVAAHYRKDYTALVV